MELIMGRRLWNTFNWDYFSLFILRHRDYTTCIINIKQRSETYESFWTAIWRNLEMRYFALTGWLTDSFGLMVCQSHLKQTDNSSLQISTFLISCNNRCKFKIFFFFFSCQCVTELYKVWKPLFDPRRETEDHRPAGSTEPVKHWLDSSN